jgi:hypothetical protein
MINITLTEEQLFTLVHQLPKEKKKELLEHLQFEEWLDTPEALQMKTDSEKAINEGRVHTIAQVREALRNHGKKI